MYTHTQLILHKTIRAQYSNKNILNIIIRLTSQYDELHVHSYSYCFPTGSKHGSIIIIIVYLASGLSNLMYVFTKDNAYTAVTCKEKYSDSRPSSRLMYTESIELVLNWRSLIIAFSVTMPAMLL